MSALMANVEPRGPVAWPASVWRADDWAAPAQRAWSSGFTALDAELPGGGWPGHALTEILLSHEGSIEWRLLAPLLTRLAAEGRETVLVGPPQPPHPVGLRLAGLPARQLVWLRADTAADRLWCMEQLLKARSGAVVLVWLPQARAAQLRRLQVLAAGCEAPVFVCRPEAAARAASPAPLRVWAGVETGVQADVHTDVQVGAAPVWAMSLDILKRRGPPLARRLQLQGVPAGLAAVLPPRLLSWPQPVPEKDRVVVRPVPEPAWH